MKGLDARVNTQVEERAQKSQRGRNQVHKEGHSCTCSRNARRSRTRSSFPSAISCRTFSARGGTSVSTIITSSSPHHPTIQLSYHHPVIQSSSRSPNRTTITWSSPNHQSACSSLRATRNRCNSVRPLLPAPISGRASPASSYYHAITLHHPIIILSAAHRGRGSPPCLRARSLATAGRMRATRAGCAPVPSRPRTRS